MFDSVSLGQDFGFNHANCILTVGFRDGNIFVIDELYSRFKDTHEIIDEANKRQIPKNLTMWCDSAEPDRIKSWRKAGYRAQGVKKEPGSIGAQIDYLKSHRLVIDPRCENLIREIGEWKWKRDPVSSNWTDEPVSINDDCIASLRYAIEGERRGRRVRAMSKSKFGL
jgi:phage terminase large subunit